MCDFITATSGRTRNEDAIRKLAESLQLNWVPLDNPTVTRHLLLPDEKYYSTCRGICDCGTELGRRHRSVAPDQEAQIQRELLKHRKRGWTETRIQRWLEQRRAAEARGSDKFATDSWPEIDRWIEFLTRVVEGKFAEWVGVLLHSYHGDIESERLPVNTPRWLACTELTRDVLLDVEMNVLCRFSRTGQKL